jgi:hypothetical protein
MICEPTPLLSRSHQDKARAPAQKEKPQQAYGRPHNSLSALVLPDY